MLKKHLTSNQAHYAQNAGTGLEFPSRRIDTALRTSQGEYITHGAHVATYNPWNVAALTDTLEFQVTEPCRTWQRETLALIEAQEAGDITLEEAQVATLALYDPQAPRTARTWRFSCENNKANKTLFNDLADLKVITLDVGRASRFR
ncbi:MAG: hypothetical protein V3R81_03595 [Gammaproteobacteria bacterium]